MANLGEYLNATFTSLGVEVENPALKELVTKAANIEMNDELVSKFNQGYFTIEAAKNNPKIISDVKAKIYNGEDENHKTLMDKYQLDEAAKAELLAEKSTPKRREILIDKIIALKAEKADADPAKKSELNDKITALNTELATLKGSTIPKAKFDEMESTYKKNLTDHYMNGVLQSKNYADPAYKDEDYLLPKSKIAKALEEKKLRTVLVDNKIKLETTDGLDYFENNKKVDFNSFADSVLAQNKYTAVSGATTTMQTTSTTQGATQQKGLNKAQIVANQKVAEAQAMINHEI
jgi:hypothetical protein